MSALPVARKSKELSVWEKVPSISDLGAYSRFVNSIPMLEEGEEVELATRLREKEDLGAAQRLILSHLRVVVKAAREYQGYGLPQEDLIQEGNIGLMKAVRRFDPSRGVRLVSYAILWIKAEMQEFILENWRLVKIGSTKSMKKLFFGLRSLRESLGSKTETEKTAEIAKRLGVSEEEVKQASVWFSGGEESISPLSAENESPRDLVSLSLNPEEALSKDERTLAIPELASKALASLNERERKIIQARFLSEKAQTLGDLGKELGISLERVRQIEGQALKKMKQSFKGDEATVALLLKE